MQKIFKYVTLAFVVGLSACGGGGGSPGTSNLPYSISLTTTKTQLPVNLSLERAGISAYSPFTTTLYIDAREGSAPIPGGSEIFGCNVAGGLESGALYYLDGKPEHEVEVDDGKGGKIKVPGAYRSIVLDSNSGGNSFHFHSGDKAGTARITCTVTNPADKLVSSASVDIIVGAATGKPASVTVTTQGPRPLGTSDNVGNLPKAVAISAKVMDDANQPIPDPVAANLQVSIRPFGASAGARLLSGSQSGSTLQVKTIGGEGQLSISSGPSSGAILLDLTADRFDNDVSNGIQDPVVQLAVVRAYDAIASAPLVITGDEEITVANGLPFTFALTADGGLAPYSWSTLGGLPAGLSLDGSGVISGTPRAAPGSYTVSVRVTDASGTAVTRSMVFKVEGVLIDPLSFVINGCAGALNTACPLPDATTGTPYIYAFSATGGDPAVAITWTFTTPVPALAWLSTATVGENGVISGIPVAGDSCNKFFVTAKRGTFTVTRQVSIKVNAGVCP